MTGYALSDYGLVLVIWGIVWILFGTGIVYLLVRYFSREEAEEEAVEAPAMPATAAPVVPPVALPERELVATGHR